MDILIHIWGLALGLTVAIIASLGLHRNIKASKAKRKQELKDKSFTQYRDIDEDDVDDESSGFAPPNEHWLKGIPGLPLPPGRYTYPSTGESFMVPDSEKAALLTRPTTNEDRINAYAIDRIPYPTQQKQEIKPLQIAHDLRELLEQQPQTDMGFLALHHIKNLIPILYHLFPSQDANQTKA